MDRHISLQFPEVDLNKNDSRNFATDGNLVSKGPIFDKLLTIEELSEIINFSIGALYKLVHRGKIPHYKIGNSLRFSLGEVLESASIQGRKK